MEYHQDCFGVVAVAEKLKAFALTNAYLIWIRVVRDWTPLVRRNRNLNL